MQHSGEPSVAFTTHRLRFPSSLPAVTPQRQCAKPISRGNGVEVTAETNADPYPRLAEAAGLLQRGLGDEAAAIVIEHLREHREEPRGLALLGEIAMKAGALLQAEQFLTRAIARGATSYPVQRNLAATILKQDRLEEALAAYGALAEQVDDLGLVAVRGMILDRLGRTDEAIAEHERVIADSRADAGNWVMYGHSLRFAGRTDDALAAYRRALQLDPDRGDAWWSLADVKSKVLTDDDIALLDAKVAGAGDSMTTVPLHMALGRGWHDRGDYLRAFDHYRKGNQLRAQAVDYNPGDLSHEVDEVIRTTLPGQFGPPAEIAGPTPVFLVGLPRSGSTLLEQILGRHSEIEAVGELPYIRALMRSSLEVHMQREALEVPEYIKLLSLQEKRSLGAEYLRRAAHHRHKDARYFIDKMPSNWADILFIREILPQARFIEIRRDPMDCCFSNYTHHFGAALAASFDLTHQARAWIDYTRLMDHLKQVAPGLICSIRYEDLVEQPEKEITKALDYLGLKWTDDLLRFHESGGSVRTPSTEQVRRPLNRAGIGRWRPYAEWLQPLRDELGALAES
jgi:tetratricopeptide (TPR) repeat protein